MFLPLHSLPDTEAATDFQIVTLRLCSSVKLLLAVNQCQVHCMGSHCQATQPVDIGKLLLFAGVYIVDGIVHSQTL